MRAVNNHLGRFEKIVERLVEGAAARLLPAEMHPQEIIARMARAMEDQSVGGVAPDRFTVLLSDQDYQKLLGSEPELAFMLAETAVQLAQQAKLELQHPPVVELQPDARVGSRGLAITGTITPASTESTQAINLDQIRPDRQLPPDGTTYLILDGQQHIPLSRTLYTLGRRLDCDIVISDPRVSRQHAQLRWRFGRYVLFDLGSRAGTTVNDHLVSEAALEPGDVFSLGGVEVIYGREGADQRVPADGDTTGSWHGPQGRRQPGTG
jgi:pSer/pThr/pTyr-binding forkhead associated (FHA) protein